MRKIIHYTSIPGSDNDHHNSTVFYKGALQTIAVMEGMTHVHLVMVVAVVSVDGLWNMTFLFVISRHEHA